MAWMCMEGFDGLGAYDQLPLRSWRSIGAGLTYSASGGRRGGGCIVDDTTGSTTERGIEFSNNFFDNITNRFWTSTMTTSDVEIGMAIEVTGDFKSLLTNGWAYPLCSLKYGASSELLYWELVYSSGDGGYLYVRQRYGTTTRITGTGVKLTDSDRWYYLTFLLNGINSSASTQYQYILVDNIEAGSYTVSGINSSYSTSGPSLFKLGAAEGVSGNLPSGMTISYDDVIFTAVNGDGETPLPNITSTLAGSTYIGPCRVDKLVGTKDSSYLASDFAPSSGSDAYAMVDETGAHDGDTTYLSSNTVLDLAMSGDGMALPVTPLEIVGVRGFAVVKNVGDAAANVKCGLASYGSRSQGDRTRTLAAGGSYEGLMSYGSDREGAYDAASTLWSVSTLSTAQTELAYVS